VHCFLKIKRYAKCLFYRCRKAGRCIHTFLTAISRIAYKNPISANINNKLFQETGKGNFTLIRETYEQQKRLYSKLSREFGTIVISILENPDTIEVCVNSDGRIWMEGRNAPLHDTGKTLSADKLLAALGTIAAMLGTELNESSPILEGRLPLDGSRVEGSIPPVSPDGPSISIRKHASAVFPLEQYITEGRIQERHADYLRKCIAKEKNILIAGGTSSGKTTFTNALIKELLGIAPKDRLIIMEDTLELQCATVNKQNFVTSDNVSMRKLLKMAMRYRPDRIIIGEVRGGEALDLLKSWNTGHPGGFATVHANSAASSLIRLEQLILEVSQNSMPTLIAEAIDVVVYMEKRGKFGRQVTEIIEVRGYKEGVGYEYESIYDAGTKSFSAETISSLHAFQQGEDIKIRVENLEIRA
jgi:type IV secretion system protein VirB11